MTKAERKAKEYRLQRRRNLAYSSDRDWDSLRTHLADAVVCKESDGNELWHAQCCFDYAFSILTKVTELLELAKVDFKEEHVSQQSPIL